jgi:hypothetical protein
MPGFLMHLIEGENILKHMNKCNSPDSRDYLFCQQFLLGCILPDITDNKELTHFRPAWQKHLITKYPDMEYIFKAYVNDNLSAFDMGIIAHLQLDALYVTDFWPKYFYFQNEAGENSCDTREKLYVNIHSSNEIIPLKQFFSDEYFYGEYDILNPYLFKKYNINRPDINVYNKQFIHITECIPKNVDDIKQALDMYIHSYTSTSKDITHTYLFPPEDIIEFLNSSAEVFMTLDYHLYQ